MALSYVYIHREKLLYVWNVFLSVHSRRKGKDAEGCLRLRQSVSATKPENLLNQTPNPQPAELGTLAGIVAYNMMLRFSVPRFRHLHYGREDHLFTRSLHRYRHH